MKKVGFFTFLILLGLALSQCLILFDETSREWIEIIVKSLTLTFLAFIMIQVGLEFSLDRSRLSEYGCDHFVAFIAASLPWLFCTFYFVYFFQHRESSSFDIWTDSLLLARFAAPTSAGVLLTMLAAAGLKRTWTFKKARILAIFDDIDTILLLIPIQMLILGFRWEMLLLLILIPALLYLAWKKIHSITWPLEWYWVLFYSVVLAATCESIYAVTTYLEDIAPLQLKILLPAFVLGCILSVPDNAQALFHRVSEKRAQFLIGSLFIFFVGLSMPTIEISPATLTVGGMPLGTVLWHVLIISLVSNLGKMFPLFCYRKEAGWKERLALSLGMCSRGEVGAGVIVIALGLTTHIDNVLIVIAMLSLALNLILTGPIIMIIKKLLKKNEVLSR